MSDESAFDSYAFVKSNQHVKMAKGGKSLCGRTIRSNFQPNHYSKKFDLNTHTGLYSKSDDSRKHSFNVKRCHECNTRYCSVRGKYEITNRVKSRMIASIVNDWL